MKGILVILDGLGDLPCKQFNGKTPLEAANCVNMDYLASKGELGYMYPINERFVPESDQAVISILGNKVMGSQRGQFEAIGADMNLKKGDLAFRTNFETIDNLKNKKILDRRAGRTLTTKEANILAKAINKKVKLQCDFIFENTVQHRGVLVLRGGFSDNISNTDPVYHSGGKIIVTDKFKFSKSLDDEEDSKYAANILNDFIEQSYKVLNEHPINEERRKKKLKPANIILTRGGAVALPKMKKFRKWAGIINMPLEIGIAKASGMRIFSFPYPPLKSLDFYDNLYAGLKRMNKFAKKIIKKNYKKYDYFYVHFKETDITGHDNKPNEKKWMIEYIDNKFFSFLNKFAEKHNIKVIVTGDHSTPCKLKAHSADPLPLLVCDWGGDVEKQFSEKQSKKGKLGKLFGKDVLKLF